MKRRHFLLGAAGVGGAMIVGWGLLPPRGRLGTAAMLPPAAGRIALNAWVRLGEDGTASLVMPRVEMGQGVHTAIPMLLAEELRLPLERIQLEPPPPHAIYGNVAVWLKYLPFPPGEGPAGEDSGRRRVARWLMLKIGREVGLDITAASSSVSDAWTVVRMAGATARQLIVEQAARQWRVAPGQCTLADGMVSHPEGYSAGIGAFVASAAQNVPEAEVRPTPREEWRVIGRSLPRVDLPGKTDGTARFGIDVRLPGMLFAAVRLAPVLGDELDSLDEPAVLARPGVEAVVRLPAERGATGGFAVVARDSWSARRAAEAAVPRWRGGGARETTSEGVLARLRTAVDSEDGFAVQSRGDLQAAFSQATSVVEARYEVPFLAHAAMEPPNATAWLRDGRLTVWAPTQVPGPALRAAIETSGLAPRRVELERTLVGGGFGRGLEVDVIRQVVRVAMALPGRPVQLLWSREQDLAHDWYRPAFAARFAAALDRGGRILGWRLRTAGDSVALNWLVRNRLDIDLPVPDTSSSEGLFDQAYDVPARRVEHVRVRSGIPVGNWRSVGHSHNAFFLECFIDELAERAGVDPLRYRLDLLRHAPRHRAVLEFAADRGGWGEPLPPGRARGLAMHECYGTIVAMVAEVGQDPDGGPRVHRVCCALDCGAVVNPGIVAQQMEGGVVFGLSAALHGRIDVEAGRVAQGGFGEAGLLRLAETPLVETHIVPSTRPPAGVGEPGVPPIAPAVANALFALTGQRHRRLPMRPT